MSASRYGESKHRVSQDFCKTPPSQIRKRKATENLDRPPKTKKQIKVDRAASSTLAATPPTTASNSLLTMESDDEFMSGASSQEDDFAGTQDSDDGSLGEGVYMDFMSSRLSR